MGDYSDDDLDDIPDSVLQELENNAIQSTQAVHPHHARSKPPPPGPAVAPPAKPRHQYDTLGLDEDEDLDLDDSELFNNSLGAIPRPALVQAPALPQARAVPIYAQPPKPAQHQQQRWNTPRAPAVPQGNISGPPPAPTGTQRFQPSQRFRKPPEPPNRQQPSQFPRGFAPPPPRYAPSQSHAPAPIHPNDVVGLERQLRTLEAELANARGEAMILRANAARVAQTHQAEVARLKKESEKQQEQHDRAVQSAQIAERHAATELQFLQRDMQEVASMARRKDTAGCAGAGTGSTTPKRAIKSWGVADGFDGMDLVPSPTKANIARPKSTSAMSAAERTPSKGKRRRPVADSPILPLDTHTQTSDVVMHGNTEDATLAPLKPVTVPPGPTSLYSLPIDFLPLILDHASAHGQPPTFDTFSQYFFPSDPNTSFSSIIFQSLPTRSDPSLPLKLLKDFSVLIIKLWSRCLEEEFFMPIRELVSLLSFTLQLHSVEIVPELLEALLPVAQPTLYVIADLQNPEGNLNGNPDLSFLQASLDSTAIIALLNLCAQSSATSSRDGERGEGSSSPRVAFWKKFGMDTVAFVLGPRQPICDIVGMLEMLSTSVQPTSIGPILPDRTPVQAAANLLDKLTRLLINIPLGAGSASQRHAVSVAVLQTLFSFSASEFALVQMARHENLVLRLIECLSRAVEELYDQDVSYHSLPPHPEPEWRLHDALSTIDSSSDVPGLCRVLSLAMMLLHVLVTDPRTAHEVHLEAKLESWRPGAHKYLVMLCRLNFADDELWLERGVDVETSERAHELLERFVDPVGGRDIGEAFGTPED